MQSSVSVIHSLSEGTREELFRDIALAEYIERQHDAAQVQITYDRISDLLQIDDTEIPIGSSCLAVRGNDLAAAEVSEFYRLDLFEDHFFSPLLRPVIANEHSSLMHEYRCAYTSLRKAGYYAQRDFEETGEFPSPSGDTFWNESRRFIEFVREAIQGISTTRRGLQILTRLDAKINE
jgi:hypothetical protein